LNIENSGSECEFKIFSVNKTEGRSSGKSFPKTDQTSFCSAARFSIVEKMLPSNEEPYSPEIT
jgi:hypothetical protein